VLVYEHYVFVECDAVPMGNGIPNFRGPRKDYCVLGLV